MSRWLLAVALASAAVAAPADDNPFLKKPAADKKPADKEKDKPADDDKKVARVAHVKLSGGLDEGPVSSESLFGAPPENLRIKLDRIRKAAKDDRVQALYLEVTDLSAGFGKLNEIRTAVKEFKATGKKVFAYAEEYDAKAYLVAVLADQVVIPESGGLNVTGLRAEVTYYKNALDLIKVEMDVLKMGAYKSAVEPYLTDKMSKENREQLEALLDDNYEQEIVAALIAAKPEKKWTPEQVKAAIDQGPFTAKKALALGLVDKLQYEDEFEAGLAKALGADEARIVRDYGKAKAADIDTSNPFALFAALGGNKKKKESKEPKIAVIYVIGGIASGKGDFSPLTGGESAGSDTIVAAIREADSNPTVKAIVLRVDSPGGSALASDVIWRALKVCKKPVVASMGDVAASGGYYVCMNAKKIFAEPGTITGSIGVFGLKPVTGKLEAWAGLNTETVQRGKNAGIESMTFKWTDSQRQAMTETIEDVYAQFIDKGLAGRKAAGQDLTREKLLSYAGGRVWTGRQAKERGLVDELGTVDDAIAAAKKYAGVDPKEEMELLHLPKASSPLDKLLDGDFKLPFGVAKTPAVEKALKVVGPLLASQKDPIKVLLPYHIELK